MCKPSMPFSLKDVQQLFVVDSFFTLGGVLIEVVANCAVAIDLKLLVRCKGGWPLAP